MSRDNPSIKDVAEYAGVSTSTVSRILNNTDYPVSEEFKKKVLKAVNDLNYYPNLSARNLRLRESNTLGLIVRDISDPYYGSIAKGVTDKSLANNIMPIICNTGRHKKEEINFHELLWNYRVRGIILAGGGMNEKEYIEELNKQIKRLQKQGLKLIALAPQCNDNISVVSVDNKNIGYMITEFLIKKGHTDIAFIGGPKNIITSVERFKGYKTALQKYSLTFNKSYIEWSDYTWEGGYKKANILMNKKQKFSAIVCANDNIAIGVLKALKAKNIKVPKDISIISIGNIPVASYTNPPLTTASIPLEKLGAKGVEILLKKKCKINNIYVKSKIIERESVCEI